MFSPEPEDPTTWFAVWSTRLPDIVVAEDVDVMREGVEEGLSKLTDLNVGSSSQDILGNLLRFQRIYTFREVAAVRKRKVWMLYVYKWLFTLIAQGASVAEYQHWSMMLEDCFDDFDLAPTLWFASDRELASDLA
jgi:hypothetical protein